MRSSSCVSRISVKGDSQFPIIKSFLWYGNDSEPHFTEITPYDTYLVRDSPETVDSSRCNKSDSHGAFALLTKNLLVPTVVWNSRYTFRLYCITFCVVKKEFRSAERVTILATHKRLIPPCTRFNYFSPDCGRLDRRCAFAQVFYFGILVFEFHLFLLLLLVRSFRFGGLTSPADAVIHASFNHAHAHTHACAGCTIEFCTVDVGIR